MTDAREVVPIASDHAGVRLKGELVAELRRLGFEPLDLGPADEASVDYPDFAHPLAGRVERGEARRGVLLCGTGLGMSCAANRHPGVRAALAWSAEVARLAREHNDSNVLVLPARFVSTEEADYLSTYLNGEALTNQDVVLWYTTHAYHEVRDEDAPYMPIEWTGFILRPRDYFDRNPMD